MTTPSDDCYACAKMIMSCPTHDDEKKDAHWPSETFHKRNDAFYAAVESGVCFLCCETKTTRKDAKATTDATESEDQPSTEPMCAPCLKRYLHTHCASCNGRSRLNDIRWCKKCLKPYCENCDGSGSGWCSSCEYGRCTQCSTVLWEEADDPTNEKMDELKGYLIYTPPTFCRDCEKQHCAAKSQPTIQ